MRWPAHLRHVLAGEQQPLRVGAEQAAGHVLDVVRPGLLAAGDDHGIEVLEAIEPADRAEVRDAGSLALRDSASSARSSSATGL